MLTILAACSNKNKINGYVEGDYVYYAAGTAGILKAVYVEKGQQASTGAALFALDDTSLKSAVTSAQAKILVEQNKLYDLEKGQRPEQINVIIKQIEQAKTSYRNAQQEFSRTKTLLNQGVISRSYYDQQETSLKTSKIYIEQLSAQLRAMFLESQTDKKNALSNIAIAKQQLIQAEKQLQESAPVANAAGRVEDIFFKPGEFIQAGTPVLSLLSPENIRVRFFVPQANLAQFALGNEVKISCDGCNKIIPAKVTYISSQGEYTPPEIYSAEFRKKLVFMVEATPLNFDPDLRPGLPVDINL